MPNTCHRRSCVLLLGRAPCFDSDYVSNCTCCKSGEWIWLPTPGRHMHVEQPPDGFVSTGLAQVQEWRRARSALTCPVMPPYPTHVPSSKDAHALLHPGLSYDLVTVRLQELSRVILEARRVSILDKGRTRGSEDRESGSVWSRAWSNLHKLERLFEQQKTRTLARQNWSTTAGELLRRAENNRRRY